MYRREFIGSAAATAASFAVRGLCGGEPNKPYTKANTDWLAKCQYGIGVHWTAQTVPRSGTPKPFQRAVADFDLKRFIAAVEHAGADYVLFTAAHALQMLPAPHPVLDTILAGRTCERDLIWEIADALSTKQKHLLVYYNHSCNSKNDPPWEQAVGYHAPNKEPFAKNLLEIVGWLGERYKDKIKAWWFDSPYSLDTRGPHNSVTTDMTGFQYRIELDNWDVSNRPGQPHVGGGWVWSYDEISWFAHRNEAYRKRRAWGGPSPSGRNSSLSIPTSSSSPKSATGMPTGATCPRDTSGGCEMRRGRLSLTGTREATSVSMPERISQRPPLFQWAWFSAIMDGTASLLATA